MMTKIKKRAITGKVKQLNKENLKALDALWNRKHGEKFDKNVFVKLDNEKKTSEADVMQVDAETEPHTITVDDINERRKIPMKKGTKEHLIRLKATETPKIVACIKLMTMSTGKDLARLYVRIKDEGIVQQSEQDFQFTVNNYLVPSELLDQSEFEEEREHLRDKVHEFMARAEK